MMVLEEFKHVSIVTNVVRERERDRHKERERERERDSCTVVRGKQMTGSRRRSIKMTVVFKTWINKTFLKLLYLYKRRLFASKQKRIVWWYCPANQE